jgi:putative ABC transport system substrate-binding protein
MLRKLIWLVTVCLLAFGNFGEAQEQPKLPKIGWLGSGGFGGALESFRREFSKLGYVDGKNIAFETRYAENKLDRLSALADELVRLKVDVLVATSSNAALAAKNATRMIPIVYVSSGDPVALGLVDSLARPGRNITGFTTIAPVLSGKRLELLKQTIPKLSRVAVLWNPQNSASAEQWKGSQQSSRELGLQLHSMEVSSVEQFDRAFEEAIKARSAALVVTQDTVLAALINESSSFDST